MDAPARPWPPPVGAYAEERELFRLLQVNGPCPPRRHRGEAPPTHPGRGGGLAGPGGGEGHPAPGLRFPPGGSPEPGPAMGKVPGGKATRPFPPQPVPGSCGNARAGV